MNEHLLSEDLKDLHIILSDLKRIQQRQSSLRWNFWRGVVYGFGFFIGSAVLTAVIVYIIAHLSIDGDNFFGRFINFVIAQVEKSK